MARQYPLRGPVPLIVQEDTARQYPVRDTILNDTTVPPAPPATAAVVVFVAT